MCDSLSMITFFQSDTWWGTCPAANGTTATQQHCAGKHLGAGFHDHLALFANWGPKVQWFMFFQSWFFFNVKCELLLGEDGLNWVSTPYWLSYHIVLDFTLDTTMTGVCGVASSWWPGDVFSRAYRQVWQVQYIHDVWVSKVNMPVPTATFR